MTTYNKSHDAGCAGPVMSPVHLIPLNAHMVLRLSGYSQILGLVLIYGL